MKIKSLIMITAAALMLCSCSTPKGITYLQGVDSLPDEVLKSAAAHNEPVVQPGDMLQINVSSSNPEVVKPFNKTEYIATSTGANNISNGDNSIYFYLVDNNGYIDFPLLGHIKIGGMTQLPPKTTLPISFTQSISPNAQMLKSASRIFMSTLWER